MAIRGDCFELKRMERCCTDRRTAKAAAAAAAAWKSMPTAAPDWLLADGRKSRGWKPLDENWGTAAFHQTHTLTHTHNTSHQHYHEKQAYETIGKSVPPFGNCTDAAISRHPSIDTHQTIDGHLLALIAELALFAHVHKINSSSSYLHVNGIFTQGRLPIRSFPISILFREKKLQWNCLKELQ